MEDEGQMVAETAPVRATLGVLREVVPLLRMLRARMKGEQGGDEFGGGIQNDG